jgi:energy-coupling factor transporter transmembrane protein EcfT
MLAQVLLRLGGRLFSNLMQRSEAIALAMHARGFAGPAAHRVHLAGREHVPLLPNALAVLLLPAVVLGAQRVQYLF